MKIQTNVGDVELTAAMVVRGMVFQDPAASKPNIFDDNPSVYRNGAEGMREVQEALAAGVRHGAIRFLGCDPTIATRADCERFGVHGDAAAHGFARLRGGGAVDLRRVPPTGTVYTINGGRRTKGNNAPLIAAGRFIGLDARYASRKDLKRLCCGAERTGDMVTNAITGEPIEVPAHRCTLAIGEHDEHEDLATGVRWSDAPTWPKDSVPRLNEAQVGGLRQQEASGAMPRHDRVREEVAATGDLSAAMAWSPEHVCGKCGGPASTMNGRPLMIALASGGVAKICEPCAGIIHANVDVNAYEIRDGRIVVRSPSLRSTAYGFRFSAEPSMFVTAPPVGVPTLTKACPGCGCRGTCEWRTHGKVDPDAVTCSACGCRWCGPPTPEFNARSAVKERQRQEAALVALVNAVPDGLDARGWAAAVLAIEERRSRSALFRSEATPDLVDRYGVAAILRRGTLEEGHDGAMQRGALAAYQRAITPHRAPPPERKRGGRDARVVLDDGRDE